MIARGGQFVNARIGHTNDATGQLTDADYDGTPPDEGYQYDDNGNRTNTGYQTGAYNRLTSDGTYTYEYDAEGNRTMRYVWTDADTDDVVDPGERSQITEYAWDHRNRLVSVTERATEGGQATKVVDYVYDAFNRLVGETVDGQVDYRQAFVYDGNQIVLEFKGEGSADLGATDLAHRYLWGNAVDQILADEQVHYDDLAEDFVTDRVLWPLVDQVGTARDLAEYDAQTDTTTITNHRVYDSFGNLTSETNSAVDCLFGFTARPFDEATGLQNNLNRWYDPAVGRWTSEDPIGFAAGDPNTYRYVANRPASHIDPLGLDVKLTVDVKGNVHITLPIKYTGSGATDAVKQKFNAGIEKAWSGQFGKYNVTTKVVEMKPGEKGNVIDVPLGDGTASVNLSDLSSGSWPSERPCRVAAHEAGHLMGLSDRANSLTGVPQKGWEGNIMADAVEGKVEEKNIEGVIKAYQPYTTTLQ